MRLRMGLLLATAAALAVPLALLLTGSAGADTPTVLTFSGEYSSPACGPPFTFTVPSGITTIDVAATTDVPANDITLALYQGSKLIFKQDTGTSPEAIHYAPDGGVAPGGYSVIVCPFADNPQVPPETYHGTVTLSSAPSTQPPVVGPPPAERLGPPATFNTSAGIS